MFIENNGNVIVNKKIYSREFGIIAMLLLVIGIILSGYGFFMAPEGAILFVIGIYICVLSYIVMMKSFAKYEFCRDGIWIKYPLREEQLHYWVDFQQICICYTYIQFESAKYVEIVFVKNGEEPNRQGRWNTQNPFKFHRIIGMDYSEGLYEKIKKYCPYEVVDLRGTKSYR